MRCTNASAFLLLATAFMAAPAHALDKLPEALDPQIRRLAAVFDFDTDSCYPSPAIDANGNVNSGMSVTQWDTSFVSGCRNTAQLNNSNTYHRMAAITKNGVTYAVRMYALYFMKDKDWPFHQAEGGLGHRHDWEYALVWTRNGVLTHASYSHHGKVTTEAVSKLYFDGWCPECTKIVYHKDGGTTHAMRFAGKNEQAENGLNRWVTPTIVDWHRMPGQLRTILNSVSFGAADCSVNDKNFPNEISKSPPGGDYPNGDEWKAAGMRPPVWKNLDQVVKPQ